MFGNKNYKLFHNCFQYLTYLFEEIEFEQEEFIKVINSLTNELNEKQQELEDTQNYYLKQNDIYEMKMVQVMNMNNTLLHSILYMEGEITLLKRNNFFYKLKKKLNDITDTLCF